MCNAQNNMAAQAAQDTKKMPDYESQVDKRDLTNKYNTKLSPKEELQFNVWANKEGKSGDVYDYDLRGAWKEMQSGSMKADDRGHLGDKYKKPNHPTFSDQSVYNGKDGYVGGKWGKEGGKDTFTPSKTNMLKDDELIKYFKEREPNVKLKARDGYNGQPDEPLEPNTVVEENVLGMKVINMGTDLAKRGYKAGKEFYNKSNMKK
jgi:hypothetical protein